MTRCKAKARLTNSSAWYSPLHFAQRDPSADAGAERARGPEAFGWSALPIVPLLKAEPKQSRPGKARREKGGERKERTLHSSRIRSHSPLLAPHSMRPTGEGVICGKVRGGAGAQLRLTHGDGFAYESLARTERRLPLCRAAGGPLQPGSDQPCRQPHRRNRSAARPRGGIRFVSLWLGF